MGFETAFAIVTAVLLVSSTAVVRGLRFVLRKWSSVWRKGLLIHAINTALDFAPLSNWPHAKGKVLEDSGFTNGSRLATMMTFAAEMKVWGFLGGGHAHDGLGMRLPFASAERLVRDWPKSPG